MAEQYRGGISNREQRPSIESQGNHILDIDLEQIEAESLRLKLENEATTHDDYVRTISIYLRLKETVDAVQMPDLYRVSASMPLEVDRSLDDAVDELMTLSLHAQGDRGVLKRTLETMIKKGTIDQEVARLRGLMEVSQRKIATLQAPASLGEDTAARLEREKVLLGRIRNTTSTPMPVVGEQSPEEDGKNDSGRHVGLLKRFQNWLQ